MDPRDAALVVHVRADADKAAGLPSLVKVLAAGWHGIGTVHHAPPVSAAAIREVPPPTARCFSERRLGPSRRSAARRRLRRRAAQAADMEPLFDMIPPVSPGTISSPAELVAARRLKRLRPGRLTSATDRPSMPIGGTSPPAWLRLGS